jgi:hypothetical protein
MSAQAHLLSIREKGRLRTLEYQISFLHSLVQQSMQREQRLMHEIKALKTQMYLAFSQRHPESPTHFDDEPTMPMSAIQTRLKEIMGTSCTEHYYAYTLSTLSGDLASWINTGVEQHEEETGLACNLCLFNAQTLARMQHIHQDISCVWSASGLVTLGLLETLYDHEMLAVSTEERRAPSRTRPESDLYLPVTSFA